ncbi:MAG TPA: phosphate ABC transporter ATP-binding protein PstB [Candidatus Limnocylindrales bacterium]|nr:phosphate ABC transporter ATP-binding protein PstB [Candidatus Limnocylindrales bacterium]
MSVELEPVRMPIMAPTGDGRLPLAAPREPIIRLADVNAYYGTRLAVRDVSMEIRPNAITAIIGPSGSGKSTLLRCIDRMHEIVPHARVTGRIEYRGIDIYDDAVDPAAVRRSIGMVFQQPNPFPTMSIADNVSAPARFNGLVRGKGVERDLVERCLRAAALWDEVKDKLQQSGSSLSGGQQQRLCIARALAMAPDVLLMDEPCSALDPVATLQVEQLMLELKRAYTIVIVTHNMQQASRVSDRTAFFTLGEDGAGHLVEEGPTGQIFTAPRERLTEDYISGRFG